MSTVLTKKDIVKKLAVRKETSLIAAAKLWEEINDFIYQELVVGNGVKIKGVGTIRRVERAPYEARVPNTNETTQVPARFSFKLKSKRYDIVEA